MSCHRCAVQKILYFTLAINGTRARAVFHPDDELVEGYKGRYFEVRLKDASKSVKLLFKAGDYYREKSLFRKNYGSTIGAFVSEALNSMKKADRGKVQLFIQGSADITGKHFFGETQ